MSRHVTFHAVCNAFSRYFEVHPTQIQSHQDLRNDWGLNSLELEWLVQQIEATTGIELESYNPLPKLDTIGQLVRLFRAQDREKEAN